MGDDALFMQENGDGLICGVADGVGGWADQGVDPSIFATGLMFHCNALAAESAVSNSDDEDSTGFSDPREMLAVAYELVKRDNDVVAGSSTACVASFGGSTGQLTVANLGDSSFYILRNGKCIHQQPAQTHYFNCPLQLAKGGGADSYSDSSLSADLFETSLQHNDLVMLATDGFTDNVWPEELEQLVKLTMPEGQETETLKTFALSVCEYARLCGFKEDKRSPFEAEAARHGYKAPGGKVDDVTVLAVLCQER